MLANYIGAQRADIARTTSGLRRPGVKKHQKYET